MTNLPYQIIIRVDSAKNIGLGHIMRCMAFAQFCQQKNIRCLFVCCELAPALHSHLQALGLAYTLITGPIASTQDAIQTSQLALKHEATTILFHGYHFSEDFLIYFQDHALQLIMIDDFGAVPNFINGVINQNPWANKQMYSPRCQTFLGLEYALLRAEYWPYFNWLAPVKKGNKVLLNLGGTDPYQTTEKIIKFLNRISQLSLEVVVISPDSERIKSSLTSEDSCKNHHFVWHTHVTNFSELLIEIDFAITAAGSTCWELALMQIPVLTIVQAENQIPVAQAVVDRNFGQNLGWYHALEADEVTLQLNNFITDLDRRQLMSQTAYTSQIGTKASEIIHQLNL